MSLLLLFSGGSGASPRIVELLLQTVIVPGAQTNEGRLIEAVSIPWFEIVALLEKNPSAAFEIPSEKWEEVIAGAYKAAGFEQVILPPAVVITGAMSLPSKRDLVVSELSIRSKPINRLIS